MQDLQLSASKQYLSVFRRISPLKTGLTWFFGGKGVLGDNLLQEDDVMPC